jgi:hypothetical protein
LLDLSYINADSRATAHIVLSLEARRVMSESEERSQWWMALTGLTALAVVLAVLSAGVASLETSRLIPQDTQFHVSDTVLSDTVMRLMLGKS